jgi:hypothetical protein
MRVKVPSSSYHARPGGRTLASAAITGGPEPRGERARMADLAFAVLLIAGFVVLTAVLRGLEKL